MLNHNVAPLIPRELERKLKEWYGREGWIGLCSLYKCRTFVSRFQSLSSIEFRLPAWFQKKKKLSAVWLPRLTCTVKLRTSLGYWGDSPYSSKAEYATELFSKESVRSGINEGVDGTADEYEVRVN